MHTQEREGNALLCLKEVAAFFGNIDRSTVYRHVRRGLIPAPIKVGSSSRWLADECRAALQAMIAGRARQ
jgi:predicted DNA-binding transcriptional regulator AlpA